MSEILPGTAATIQHLLLGTDLVRQAGNTLLGLGVDRIRVNHLKEEKGAGGGGETCYFLNSLQRCSYILQSRENSYIWAKTSQY